MNIPKEALRTLARWILLRVILPHRLLSGQPRRWLTRHIGLQHPESTIGSELYLDSKNFRVASGASVGSNLRVLGAGRVLIESGAHIGDGVVLDTRVDIPWEGNEPIECFSGLTISDGLTLPDNKTIRVSSIS